MGIEVAGYQNGQSTNLTRASYPATNFCLDFLSSLDWRAFWQRGDVYVYAKLIEIWACLTYTELQPKFGRAPGLVAGPTIGGVMQD